MTQGLADLCALALYALPLLAFIGVRARRDTPLLLLALDVPLVVALDLLGIVLLACVVPLEVATLVSRPLWFLGCAAWVWWRRRRGDSPRWPTSLGSRNVAALLIAGALGVWLSVVISRHYDMWDRYWHQPQVTAIAMQRIPFVNVFEPEAPLRYHYLADVYACVLRTLSFDVINSAHALALTHDIAFGLTAATVAMLMLGLGQRHRWLSVASSVGVLMHGPIAVQATALAAPDYAVMYSNYLTNSFRPHVALAGLFMVGYVGVAAGRLLGVRERSATPSWTRLLPLAAVSSLTDETSIAMLGLGLGMAWLVDADVLARRRAHGLAMLAAIAAASILPSVLLGGSFAPGGPVQKLTWAAAHVPSGGHDPAYLPFPAAPSVRALFIDLLPLLAGCLGILFMVTRRRAKSGVALFVFASSIVVACTVVATHLLINGQAGQEMQRFFVVPFFAAFVIGLVAAGSARPGSIGTGLVAAAVGIPAVFTAHWLVVVVPEGFQHELLKPDPEGGVNCRRIAGAHLGERAQRKYVESSSYFPYTTCRPVFSPGGTDATWPTKIYPHFDSKEQLQALEKAPLDPDGAWPAACRAGKAVNHDPVCTRLLQQPTSCKPDGDEFLACRLTPQVRAALLKP